jgi:hypothetical protein
MVLFATEVEMKRKLFLSLAALVLVMCSYVSAAPRDAFLLGERRVDFHANRDTIDVGNYEGWFKSIYFEVEKNNIELFNMVIVYGDGQRERVETRLIFDDMTRSRIIRLKGGERRIRSIEFSYRTVGNWLEGKAHVLVYGIK